MNRYCIYFVFLCLSLSGCDPENDKMTFVNSTNDSLVVRFMFDNELPNKSINWNRSREFLVDPLDTISISIFNNWEGEFERALPEKNINVLVTKYYDFDLNPNKWDSIFISSSFFNKKYTLEEFKKKKWIILYPNDGFKKGNLKCEE